MLKEASEFTLSQLKKGNLSLELDVSERDKYGRLLAYAWIGGKMLNEMHLYPHPCLFHGIHKKYPIERLF
ncbi:thermonuclease family protein [Paenibacillus polymyxa]|uniref:thermonuclease family protein n=1 Tax=Paenibacillus polymyxa TaxID=1406 RepID=UPI002AB48C61|nr:thermonuclease family protein [Paenibacillus polymyxa]MDY8116737.1 thermonuclease family protein [Paenibacillus polymyxa]